MDDFTAKNFPPDCRLNGITWKGGFQLVGKSENGEKYIDHKDYRCYKITVKHATLDSSGYTFSKILIFVRLIIPELKSICNFHRKVCIFQLEICNNFIKIWTAEVSRPGTLFGTSPIYGLQVSS